jgi:hypothetical protein
MKASKNVAVVMITFLLLSPLAVVCAQETQPGLPAEQQPSKAFRIGGWILVGTGVVLGVLGTVLLVEGFTNDDQNTADFGKMMGIGALVTGGLSAGTGIFLIKVPLR